MLESGDRLPDIRIPPPGPRSRELAQRLREYESRNVTFVAEDLPIFWEQAAGANVLDVDGNIYIDLTGGFAVAATGHRNRAVTRAIRAQLDRLPHGLGDVHPPEIKVRLLERLAGITPGDLRRSILASSGSEAVEAALKTARLRTARPGVLCFTGGYHGLTYGALSVTDGDRFRAPFEDQLGIPIVRLPFPTPDPVEAAHGGDPTGAALALVRSALEGSTGPAIGAVLVEPIQARAGVRLPPSGFLPGLREICDGRRTVLILDEIYTGFGRTGRWFACQHEDIVPDLLCVGKALSGALPFSACVGRPEIMDAWPPSDGTAIHTSTFLGHPLGCAAALAQIEEIERKDLVSRASSLGSRLQAALSLLASRHPGRIGAVRGRGMLAGLELIRDPGTREPDPEAAHRLIVAALREGILLLGGGSEGNVITISPPLTITERQLDAAIATIEHCLPSP